MQAGHICENVLGPSFNFLVLQGSLTPKQWALCNWYVESVCGDCRLSANAVLEVLEEREDQATFISLPGVSIIVVHSDLRRCLHSDLSHLRAFYSQLGYA